MLVRCEQLMTVSVWLPLCVSVTDAPKYVYQPPNKIEEEQEQEEEEVHVDVF